MALASLLYLRLLLNLVLALGIFIELIEPVYFYFLILEAQDIYNMLQIS